MEVTPRPRRVALYARVSTRDKAQDSELQPQPMREYAIARGWQPTEYVDCAAPTVRSDLPLAQWERPYSQGPFIRGRRWVRVIPSAARDQRVVPPSVDRRPGGLAGLGLTAPRVVPQERR